MNLVVVPPELERSHGGLRDGARVDASALALLDVLCTILGTTDLSGVRCLDVGCGVKFSRALVNRNLPIGRYFGVDVYAPVVEFLTEAVVDPRFAYAHFDVANERYNPGGVTLRETTEFPIGDERFDVCLGYSLFTHLDPVDFEVTLSHMRRAVDPGGRAVFTVFLDEHSASGHGWIDKYSEAFGESVVGLTEGGYKDVFEEDPLRVTLYDRALVTSLLEATGWTLVNVTDPSPFAQHTVLAVAR